MARVFISRLKPRGHIQINMISQAVTRYCTIYTLFDKTCLKQRPKKTKTSFSRPIIALCRPKALPNAPREHSPILSSCIKLPLCKSKVLQNAPREYSATLPACIKLPFVFKTFVLSIFEWSLKTGFTVLAIPRK